MSQNLQDSSIGIAQDNCCGESRQIFRHFFCDFIGKPMPINIGLKAKQPPNYMDSEMVVSHELLHRPLTKPKPHAGFGGFGWPLRRPVPMSAGQEKCTQSRTGPSSDR